MQDASSTNTCNSVQNKVGNRRISHCHLKSRCTSPDLLCRERSKNVVTHSLCMEAAFLIEQLCKLAVLCLSALTLTDLQKSLRYQCGFHAYRSPDCNPRIVAKQR